MRKTHGATGTSTYSVWSSMKSRCYTKSTSGYAYYGGRGIKVCDRWLDSFSNFVEDMGEKPEGFLLDRIDLDGDYSPDNCRWISIFESNRNKSNNRFVTINGKTRCRADWCQIYKISQSTVRAREKRGWCPVMAITQPTRSATK